ncbi:DUF1285 domain-containing protein [Neptunomonas sp. XY-337]|uniref:DUF1285 domain-containing protein n=1 Tax=Neptunomonas sp. XY-337 TaxID=2561897 RepID=UPI0010AA8768|nr:DUF1285 domain-containing protein [Neptunomonas sp. XY-337]
MSSPQVTFDFAEISRQIGDATETGAPPVDRWNPKFCGDIDMQIKRDGRWFYCGTPIGRHAMVKLFSSVLWREGEHYFLKTPVEKIGIQVEDAPFHVNHLDVITRDGKPHLQFVTTTEDVVIAGDKHPIRVVSDPETGEPSPYIMIRFGMEALISRNVFYQLVEQASEMLFEGQPAFVVHSGDATFSLGTSA